MAKKPEQKLVTPGTPDAVPEAATMRSKPASSMPLAVSEKIIADISTGIYRTPAAALKELVANAHDADATRVTITTNAPDFSQLVIKDNGVGMTLERFLSVMKSIGGSRKRLENPNEHTPILNRPIIGRIGIGMLAVAQLGQRFYVSSTVRGSAVRFLAEIDLTPFHKDDAALRQLGGEAWSGGENELIEIGSVKYIDNLPENPDTQFTVITVPDPKRSLISEMHNQLRDVLKAEARFSPAEPATSFLELVEAVQNSRRADVVLDSYHHLIWELGLLCPVKYLDPGAFSAGARRVQNIKNVVFEQPDNFEVLVDHFHVRRPVLFPNPIAEKYGGPTPIIYPIAYEGTIARRRLRFSGYIYAQQPHIDPVELQGVQLRVRGVGIGGYDRTWMGYPFDEGMKFGQVSGEVYVQEGLESALNIDRASFRETDPHYLALRAVLWKQLKERVFPEFKSRQKTFSAKRTEEKGKQQSGRLREALVEAPEPIGTQPQVKEREEPAVPRTGGKKKPSTEGSFQQVLRVVDGEAIFEKSVFDRFVKELSLKQPAKERLKRVGVVLAAYGMWDRLKPDEAEALLRALAIAVEA